MQLGLGPADPLLALHTQTQPQTHSKYAGRRKLNGQELQRGVMLRGEKESPEQRKMGAGDSARGVGNCGEMK